jgi:predicted transposase/invertase (TIGR01784 family)
MRIPLLNPLQFRFDKNLHRQAKQNAAAGKPLNIMNDVVFKTVFTSPDEDSREALRLLLSDCIRRPVRDVKILNTEILPDDLLGKTIRLDIHVTFNNGEQADVEMQTGGNAREIKDRALVYAAKLLSAQSKKGRGWDTIKPVYQIFFLNFTIFHESQKVPRRYIPMEEEEHAKLNDTLEIIFFEMPKLEPFVKEYLEGKENTEALRPDQKWCIYLKYKENEKMAKLIEDLCHESEGIMHAEKAARKISRSEEKWARALFREKNEMLYNSGMANARKEGIQIGEEKGREDILSLVRQGYTADQIEEMLKKEK